MGIIPNNLIQLQMMNRKHLFWPFLRPFSSKRQADYLRSFGSKSDQGRAGGDAADGV
jgi:hypothetical protein